MNNRNNSTNISSSYATLIDIEKVLLAKIPESEPQPSLSRVERLCSLMNNPQLNFPTFHITGTNGKTSTTRMIDALLSAHGFKTGRFTSPHLELLTERISINGIDLSPEKFIQAYEQVAPLIEEVDRLEDLNMSYFEAFIGIMFKALANEKIDVGVIEVGLGGAWDATNVINSNVSILTPISLDHQHFLGNTITDIADIKTGIIKPNSMTIVAQQKPEAQKIIEQKINEINSKGIYENQDFTVQDRQIVRNGQIISFVMPSKETYSDIFLPLHGQFQAQNAAVALAAVESFLSVEKIQPDKVQEAFANITSPGRLETVMNDPLVIIDVAHNPGGAQASAQNLAEKDLHNLVGVFSIMRDKDITGILEAFKPFMHTIILTQHSQSRALSAKELGEIAETIFPTIPRLVISDFNDALHEAINITKRNPQTGGVLITGSVVTAGEARTLLKKSYSNL